MDFQYDQQVCALRAEDGPQSKGEHLGIGKESMVKLGIDSSVLTSAWQECLGALRQELDIQLFSAFIEPLSAVSLDVEHAEVCLAAPSRFLCGHIERHFKERLAALLAVALKLEKVQLKLNVDENLAAQKRSVTALVVKRVKHTAVHSPGSTSSRADSVSFLNARYTFANFVVGNNNQFCHAAALRVAEEPGKSYNPLFIYGGVGLGKTHMLHAIGKAVLERNRHARVLYMSSETFTNELIQALRNAKMEEFKNKLRTIEVLLIDDIQFMCGKERTQEEFFHTFNALYNAKRQIVLTSDKLPQEIPGIEERLQTRFSWGLTADLQAPDFETRVAILKRKAANEHSCLPEDVAHFIADKISSNVRELEGALTRLLAHSSISGQEIDMAFTERALKPLIQPRVINVSVDDIKKAVANHFSLKVGDLMSKRRTKNLSYPRHIAMYLCRKHTTCSYPEIGEQFGGRDHSSVIHAAQVVSCKVSKDHKSKELVSAIERSLFGQIN